MFSGISTSKGPIVVHANPCGYRIDFPEDSMR